MPKAIRVKVLGTGTSTGVPVVGCNCKICKSDNPKNKRLRSSIYLESESSGILIDSGPDLRAQALRAELTKVDHVLYTHAHADHVFGIDDLRPFNFFSGKTISIYATPETAKELERNFRYCFHHDPNYVGGQAPQLKLNIIEPNKILRLEQIEVLPLKIMHGPLPILGFRINNFAYLTDCSHIPDETRELLEGLETLVINGLRNRPHNTHLSIEEAVSEIAQIKPQRAFLTHISHEVEHEEENIKLKGMSQIPVELAFDGLEFDI